MNYYIYAHHRLDNGKPFYIGKGNGRRAWTKGGRNSYWNRIVAKYGYEVRIIRDGMDEELSLLAEIETINQYKRIGIELVNMTDGGEGVSNPSDEVRKKIGDTHRGKKQSQEHINKLRQSRIGRKQSDEAKEKVRAFQKSHKKTAEHNAAVSAAKKGVSTGPRSEETKKKMGASRSIKEVFKFFHKELGERLCSSYELSREFDYYSARVRELSKGVRKSYKGWTCQAA